MTFTPLPPDPDGLSRAFATARRRRLRTMGVATSAVGAVAVLAVGLAGTGGLSSLTQHDEDPLLQQPSPTATTRSASPTTTATPEPSSSATPTAAATAPVPLPHVTTSVPPVPVASHPATSDYATNDLTVSEGILRFPACNLGRSEPCTGVQSGSAQGTRLDLTGFVCTPSASSTRLHYPRSREVDLWITRGHDEVWRWSPGHGNAPAPHTRTIDRGTCTDWSYLWTQVDGNGQALPAGSYVLHAAFYADELPGREAVTDLTLGS